MISFNVNDGHMAQYASEYMVEVCEEQPRDYDRDDRESAEKIGKLRRGLSRLRGRSRGSR